MILSCRVVPQISWKTVWHSINYRNFSTSQSLCFLGPKRYSEEKYRKKDKMAENFELIYKAPMENYLSFAKNFTTGSVLVVTAALALRMYMGLEPFQSSPYLLYGKLVTDASELKIFISSFLLLSILIRVFINGYALRIYKNDGRYIAIFQGQLPMTTNSIEFKQGDVKEVSEGSTIIPWSDSRFKINRKNVTLLPNNFKTPAELFEMMIKPESKPE